MKIASIQTVLVDLPTVRPHKLSMATINHHSLVLVRMRSDDGREGLGEAAVIPHYGAETVEAIKGLIDGYLAPAVIGLDHARIPPVLARMDAVVKDNLYAKAAVEMACLDLTGKALGVPVSTLLGGIQHERIPVLWVLGNGERDKDIAEARDKLAARLNERFLVKVGKGDVREDVARALAVKAALGDAAIVHVDANQGWDEATAGWAIERLQDGGIAVIEQPLPRANIDGMRRLAERFTVPVMADEAVDTAESALAFARSHAADALSLKVTKHGGLLRTAKVAAIAEAAGMSLFGGTMLESGIGTSASAQVFATTGNLQWGCQLFGPLLFKDTITVERVQFDDFSLTVPQRPGLGMTLDEDKLRFYQRH